MDAGKVCAYQTRRAKQLPGKLNAFLSRIGPFLPYRRTVVGRSEDSQGVANLLLKVSVNSVPTLLPRHSIPKAPFGIVFR